MDIGLLYSFEENILNIIWVFLIVEIFLILEHHINICYSYISTMLTPHNPFSLWFALKKDKLNGSKFLQWYRNPRIVFKEPYLENLEKKNTFETSSKGIYVIEVNVTTSGSTSWVLDTGCGAHICTNMNGLSNIRIFEKG